MTRPADASLAAELGASYVGAIFADSPRRVTPDEARRVFESAPGLAHVGVFGTNDLAEIAKVAEQVELDVVQLHADPMADDVHALRSGFGGDIWAAVRIENGILPAQTAELIDAAEGILLDARNPARLGGTGTQLPWNDIAAELARLRTGSLVIIAGGLRAENVGEAIRVLAPDVVDVASGVEESPGVKNRQLMCDFAHAAGGWENVA